MDKRRDVPDVPQHWTVQASRHVHWAKHPTDALADALADNTRADALSYDALTDALTDALSYDALANPIPDPVTDDHGSVSVRHN